MEAGLLVVAVIALGIGVAIGRLLFKGSNTSSEQSQGVLNVDCSGPFNEPDLFLALYVPVSDVISQDRIIFDVNVIQPHSQK